MKRVTEELMDFEKKKAQRGETGITTSLAQEGFVLGWISSEGSAAGVISRIIGNLVTSTSICFMISSSHLSLSHMSSQLNPNHMPSS